MDFVFDESLVLSFKAAVEEAVRQIFEGNGMSAFQQTLRNEMNQICCAIQQQVIEFIDNQLRTDVSLREDWSIERRGRVKTVISPFGEVRYERTYFQHNKTGKHAYLADVLVGYTPHQRLDNLLEADLLQEAVDKSYAKAGKSIEEQTQGISVSGQTVLNIVRRFQPEKIELEEEPVIKREARIIYIEADENHVAHREKGVNAFDQRLIYVHEGRVQVGKDRYELIGKKYFTFPPGTKPETIWSNIYDYLDATYDLEKTEHIFISGDGVPWIKAGATYIYGAKYVLDGYHLRRAVFKAAGANDDTREALFKAVFDGKRGEMNRLLTALKEEANSESRKGAILDVQKYLNNQWPCILAMRRYRSLLVGCSAEGHVSHVLSARLSSRPMGWSYLGANQMAHLRVHRENGANLAQIYLERKDKTNNKKASGIIQQSLVSLPKAVGSSFETLGNIPSFGRGTKLWSALLRQLANETFRF